MQNKPLLYLFFAVVAALMNPSAGAQTLRQRALQRFDVDGDGVLSDTEREAVRQFLAQQRRTDEGDAPAERMTWTVDGTEREALVYLPKKTQDAPVVFGFHGHGGSSANAARSFAFQRHWPEAVIVYMQGLPTPGRLTDPEGKRNGWQHDAGDQNDRDLKFFDAVFATLKEKHRIDPSRVYATGHSNGGGFTYLLWAQRPEVFAAVAPSAAASRAVRQLKPKPAMHIAGKNDELVLFSWQQGAMDAVRKINGCGDSGEAWAKDCTLYPSQSGTPFIAFIHKGTHKYPVEAPPLIVRFFKEHKHP
jgi:polyhydroxybutyrate depolymerase